MKKSDLKILGLAGLILLLDVAAYFGCLHLRDMARLGSCRPSLILLVSQQYASENEGMFPALSASPGKFMFDGEKVHPRLYSISDFVCEFDREGPSEEALRRVTDRAAIDDWSYVYLGYFIENEEQALAFLAAYRENVTAGRNFTTDLTVPEGQGNLGGNILYRLRSVDALPESIKGLGEHAASIPVVIEWPGNHNHDVSKVVYYDGHVEVLEYPGKFPMTGPFIEGLRELDEMGALPDTSD